MKSYTLWLSVRFSWPPPKWYTHTTDNNNITLLHLHWYRHAWSNSDNITIQLIASIKELPLFYKNIATVKWAACDKVKQSAMFFMRHVPLQKECQLSDLKMQSYLEVWLWAELRTEVTHQVLNTFHLLVLLYWPLLSDHDCSLYIISCCSSDDLLINTQECSTADNALRCTTVELGCNNSRR